MNELSAEARALLEAAQRGEAPAPEARDRVRLALAARLGLATLAPLDAAPSSPTPGVPAAPVGPTAAASGSLVAKIIGGGLLVSAVSFGAGWYAGRAGLGPPIERAAVDRPVDSPQTSPSAAAERALKPDVVVAQAPEAAPVSAGVAPPAPSGPAQAHARKPSRAGEAEAEPEVTSPLELPARQSTLAIETTMLREAHAALRGNDPAAALAKLDELATQHPEGVLREERMAARILALCAAGRVADARTEAERFLVELPHSPQADRVRSSCALRGGIAVTDPRAAGHSGR